MEFRINEGLSLQKFEKTYLDIIKIKIEKYIKRRLQTGYII